MGLKGYNDRMGKNKDILDYLKACEDGSATEIIDYTPEAIKEALEEKVDPPSPREKIAKDLDSVDPKTP